MLWTNVRNTILDNFVFINCWAVKATWEKPQEGWASTAVLSVARSVVTYSDTHNAQAPTLETAVSCWRRGCLGSPRVLLRKPNTAHMDSKKWFRASCRHRVEDRMAAIPGAGWVGGMMTGAHKSFWGSSDFLTPITHPSWGPASQVRSLTLAGNIKYSPHTWVQFLLIRISRFTDSNFGPIFKLGGGT